jgi:O-antigen/teichoic acid export membrane protein
MNTSSYTLPRGLSLRANFSWTFVGNVAYAACQWGMLVVLAKLASPEKVGQFAIGLAIASPVMLFAQLRLRVVQATDAIGEYRFGDYLGLRLIATVIALLVIAGLVFVSGYHGETALVILAIGLAKSFESVSDVFYGLLQQHDRMDRIAKSMMIKGLLSLAALGTGVYLTGSVFWGSMGLVAAWALILVGYDIRSGMMILKPGAFQSGPASISRLGKSLRAWSMTELRPRWDWKTLARLTWLVLPLGFVVTLISLHTNIPRYFVEQYLGARELGIFAAMAYFDRAGIVIINALGNSASPRLSRHYVAGESSAFRVLLLKLAGIAVLLGGAGVLVALVAGNQFLTLFYGPEYAQRDVFVMLMLASAMGYLASFLTYGMTAARYLRVQLVLHITVSGVLILTCFLLVPTWGLRGAATALIAARAIQAGGCMVITGYILSAFHRQTKSTRLDAEPV